MTKSKKEEIVSKRPKLRHVVAKIGRWLFSVVIAGMLGYGAWYYRDDINVWLKKVLSSQPDEAMLGQLNDLQQQMTGMQQKLYEMDYAVHNPDFSEMYKRIDALEQVNLNTIKSKADVETMLGLLVRMDNAEERLRALSKVTDDGALILTAAMLVKEAGERGGNFVYETEVLSEIARGKVKIRNEVARLEEIAALGLPAKDDLQREFIEIYTARFPQEVAEEEVANNWKDRIYNKLHKIIKVKKSGEGEEAAPKEFSEEDRAWEIIRDFVLSGEIIRAVGIAEKPINHKLLENTSFKTWLDKAKIYQDFYESISRITANGLAVMKVKFLKS